MDTYLEPLDVIAADAFTDFLGTLTPNWGPFSQLSNLASQIIGLIMVIVLIIGVALILMGLGNGGLTSNARSESAVHGRSQIVRGVVAIIGVAVLVFLLLPIYNALTAL